MAPAKAKASVANTAPDRRPIAQFSAICWEDAKATNKGEAYLESADGTSALVQMDEAYGCHVCLQLQNGTADSAGITSAQKWSQLWASS